MLAFWIAALILVALFVGVAILVLAKRPRRIDLPQARQMFYERREWLEADFMKMGSESGIPRGLEWINGDFDDEVEFARDKKSGQLTAFVGVALQFSAIEGGGMEDVEAVANQKAATAVFRYDGDKWTATGKTVFNLNPSETIKYYQNELEKVS